MVTKVISTRIDEKLIERFDEKAAAASITRNELIAKLISDFLGGDGIVDNAVDKSIQIAVDNAVDNRLQDAIAKQLDERDRVINIAINNLRESIEALAVNEATAPANFTSALLQKVKEVAPLMLQKAA